jgi:hypothetical protein
MLPQRGSLGSCSESSREFLPTRLVFPDAVVISASNTKPRLYGAKRSQYRGERCIDSGARGEICQRINDVFAPGAPRRRPACAGSAPFGSSRATRPGLLCADSLAADATLPHDETDALPRGNEGPAPFRKAPVSRHAARVPCFDGTVADRHS